MADSWQTFGHHHVTEVLDRQLAHGQLAHAYLFLGPAGIGKRTLAVEFAARILKTNKPQNHPDFKLLDGPGEITAEMAQEFIRSLSLKPFAGARKAAIINGAENLNQQSGNALLKTLEEAAPDTVIILVANTGRLLPTLVSRCQKFNFAEFSPEELRQFLKQHGRPAAGSEVLALSFGKISRLLRLLEDAAYLQSQQALAERYRVLTGARLGERLLAVAEYQDLDREELAENFQLWLSWQAGQLEAEPGRIARLKALGEALADLDRNKNKKLILQDLFIKI
ncbi:MAG TPA: hypothetical protein VHA30_01045 [Patescibacteria group bacterium]|nr:hypothetical protein [Patescibacteria group bacterium]